jgi:putative chitinase
LLELPRDAARSAGWFWKAHGLNELADLGDQVKVEAYQRRHQRLA